MLAPIFERVYACCLLREIAVSDWELKVTCLDEFTDSLHLPEGYCDLYQGFFFGFVCSVAPYLVLFGLRHHPTWSNFELINSPFFILLGTQ